MCMHFSFYGEIDSDWLFELKKFLNIEDIYSTLKYSSCIASSPDA
jgi:hypothetical protein